MNIKKIGSFRMLFKEFDRNYYKPIKTAGGFAGRNNSYIEQTNKGERYENVLPKGYFDVISPYLRDLINDHGPIVELNNNNNNNNNNREEWKIQLTMQNSCIFTKSFEETRTIYTKGEPVKIFMGSDTKDVINKVFNILLQRF